MYVSEDGLFLGTIKFNRRNKRDVVKRVSIEADELQNAISANLEPSRNILDPDFLFVRRWANRTEPVTQLPTSDDPEECLYRSDTVALSFCGGIVSPFVVCFIYSYL